MPTAIQHTDYRQVIRDHLDRDFRVFACGKNAPTLAVIRAFEKDLGCRLPEDFVEFSTSPLGGVYIEAKEAVWPRTKAHDEVAPYWSFLYGLMAYGFATGVPEWLNMRAQTLAFREETDSRLVPFLRVVGDADVYCFDEQARVCRWDHATGEAPAAGKVFPEVFVFEVAELRKRKDLKVAEGRQSAVPPAAAPSGNR